MAKQQSFGTATNGSAVTRKPILAVLHLSIDDRGEDQLLSSRHADHATFLEC